jgi:hypothetical protein
LQLNSRPTVSLKSEFDIHASYCLIRASCPPLRLGSLRASRRWTSGLERLLVFSTVLLSAIYSLAAQRLCPSLARLRCGRWAAKRGPQSPGIHATWTIELVNLLVFQLLYFLRSTVLAAQWLARRFRMPSRHRGHQDGRTSSSPCLRPVVHCSGCNSIFFSLPQYSNARSVIANCSLTAQPNHEPQPSLWLRLGHDHSYP